ncbi:CASP-like protein 5C2 [Mucuna pruriens]|uniref:CASP-like protein 5C2 n=1 Tax=Mucuna pruriens TaxID=157652 RepID=A0A371E2T6_MUCPR|nr:CASP-like protein 5C2 [Mucuna pruriens]
MLRACLGFNYHGRMEELPGAFGSSASLALRLGQTVFSTASLLFMCLDVDFYGYTAFWLSSMHMLHLEIFTILFGNRHGFGNSLEHNIVGCGCILCLYKMFTTSTTTCNDHLCGRHACSTASVTDLLLDADRSYCPAKLCGRYQLSAAMAFLSWFLSAASCLFNFWLFPSL